MDHLGRDLHRAFAGDEDDAAPVRAPHRREIEPRQAHPAEHVRLEEANPFGVGNVLERFRLEVPKLFTRISTSGWARKSAAAVLARLRSPANP
jgi:hypothetical protein